MLKYALHFIKLLIVVKSFAMFLTNFRSDAHSNSLPVICKIPDIPILKYYDENKNFSSLVKFKFVLIQFQKKITIYQQNQLKYI